MTFQEGIASLRAEFERVAAACTDASALEALKVAYLGRSGKVRDLSGALATLPKEEKPAAGRLVNGLKQELEARMAALAERLSSTPISRKPFDVTLPGKAPLLGRRHVIYRTWEELSDLFARLGFDVVSGPEIETERNNFDALNIPSDHPARDSFDTFYIEGEWLLRSHTSPVQIRAMKERKPPLRIIAPGKVFRPDTVAASRLPMFHQIEGLMVGEDVTFAHLKGVLELFSGTMFGPQTRMRFRPSFFPFTEPSAEVDISCLLCGGKGCSACKHSGWMEILGCGMVHPRVFENVGYDPERVTGFAFGMGIERIAMLKYRIPDIRLFVENHFAFLKQF